MFKNSGAEIFVPDNKPANEAIKRTTHMAISAHQDDIEIMAYDGIIKCFGKNDKWFLGVVTTNGAGSSRDGIYADYTDEQMRNIRKIEQKKAAYVGEYGAQVLLDYPSSAVKESSNNDVVEELKQLIKMAGPQIIYTHNPADKHDTHVAVLLRTVKALREIPVEYRPEKLYACEVWRSLDWVKDSEKVQFDVASHPNLSSALLGIYDSQICGGKRYDLATAGRRMANATYAESHETDVTTSVIYALDLTPLIKDSSISVGQYINEVMERFSNDVSDRIGRLL